MQTGATKVFTIISVAILVAVIVFGFVAFTNKGKLSPELQQLLQNAGCAESDDRDLCLFLAVWENNPSYTINASQTQNEETVNHLLQSDRDRNFHLTVDGQTPRQTVSKDGFVYAQTNDVWHRQQINEPGDRDEFRESSQLEFIKIDNINSFARSGEEQCFDKNCLTYDLTDQQNSVRVWFDTTDFRLQRVLVQGENYTYSASLDYDQEFEIVAPDDAKTLAIGQQLAPGGGQISSAQTETPGLAASGDSGLPATGDSGSPEDYQKWLEQRR